MAPLDSKRRKADIIVSYACPWAHRTLIVRKLKGLEKVISYDCLDHILDMNTGWSFTNTENSETKDTVNGCNYMSEIYFKVKPDYDGRYTVPVLWDKEKNTIVNNESSEILRMLNTEFNQFCDTPEQAALDFYPPELQKKIDGINEWVYPMINSGVYRSGFAQSQQAYDTAVRDVFEGLDRVEAILSQNRYLAGNKFTEADIRLFTTLIRFDNVYVGHFKCNKKRIVDYPNIWGYTREIYQMPGIAQTINMEHITHHYMRSHRNINPYQIVSIGPDIDFNKPHGRATDLSV